MLKKCFFALIIVFLLSYCTSVQKHNAHMNTYISVVKQQEDIDFLQKKLKKVQPSLYLYISKEDLDKKFDSVRKSINKPLKPNEFFFKISPLLAAIRQGHNSMSPLFPLYTKKELQENKKKGIWSVDQLQYKWMDGKLWVLKNNSKHTGIKVGSEVVSIDTILPQNIFKKYRPTFTADGFNQTFIPFFFNQRFIGIIYNEIGFKDSLNFTFKFKDSIYTQNIKWKAPNERVKKEVKETIVKKLSKEEWKLAEAKKKKEEKFKRDYGYDAGSNTFAKKLTFTTPDSTTAYFKITTFEKGKYETVYKEVFALLEKKKTKNLILDLRNNLGGRASEVHNLYSYLTSDSTFQMAEDHKVTSRQSLLYTDIPKISYPLFVPLYPILSTVAFLKTKKDSNGEYRVKTRLSKRTPNNVNYFKGKIYVLINGSSFSASCILASKLKENKNVTFVGQETGGDFNGTVAGKRSSCKLPNSKLYTTLWIEHIITMQQSPILGRGIFPDVEIMPTLQDIISKKDPELDWVKNDILTQNQK